MQAHGRARNARKLPREFSCAPSHAIRDVILFFLDNCGP